ncbi:hypothetical protein [Roseateles sp.]
MLAAFIGNAATAAPVGELSLDGMTTNARANPLGISADDSSLA